jgi:hypothetical protein
MVALTPGRRRREPNPIRRSLRRPQRWRSNPAELDLRVSWHFLPTSVEPEPSSVEPEKAQDEHHDDDQTDEIDDAVHGLVTSRVTIQRRIVRVQIKAITLLRTEMFPGSLPELALG